jgi:hypothetical protein
MRESLWGSGLGKRGILEAGFWKLGAIVDLMLSVFPVAQTGLSGMCSSATDGYPPKMDR